MTGIIDFGSSGLDDPAVDLAALLGPFSYGEAFLRRLARTCPVTSELVERAKFYASTFPLQDAVTESRTTTPRRSSGASRLTGSGPGAEGGRRPPALPDAAPARSEEQEEAQEDEGGRPVACKLRRRS